jgi:hypothetical protein
MVALQDLIDSPVYLHSILIYTVHLTSLVYLTAIVFHDRNLEGIIGLNLSLEK